MHSSTHNLAEQHLRAMEEVSKCAKENCAFHECIPFSHISVADLTVCKCTDTFCAQFTISKLSSLLFIKSRTESRFCEKSLKHETHYKNQYLTTGMLCLVLNTVGSFWSSLHFVDELDLIEWVEIIRTKWVWNIGIGAILSFNQYFISVCTKQADRKFVYLICRKSLLTFRLFHIVPCFNSVEYVVET